MKIVLTIVGILTAVWIAYSFVQNRTLPQSPESSPNAVTGSQPTENETGLPDRVVVAQNLDTPWALAFLPDNTLLVTERPGRVRHVDSEGVLQSNPVATLQNVKEIGEGGLMGIAVHPNFVSNNFVYLYYTYSGLGNNTQNRVVRMTYRNNSLSDEKIIVDAIPGASNHNGGRIAFGPDGYLYITTGDAQDPSRAQDTRSLAGKILRVTDEGADAAGNPFGNMVYSYGHRNPQGIVWDSRGSLWATEHGPSGIQSGNDEVNLIEPGVNYGWPDIQGSQTKPGMVLPVRHSGRTATWAPAGVAIIGDSLYFGGLRGQALYEARIEGREIVSFEEHFKGEYGRIREVMAGPDGMLYIATSNHDGRGDPLDTDDRIIRIDPDSL